jgi:hypothetical protein
MQETKEQISKRLENLARKVKVLSQASADVACRVFPPQTQGNPYMVEVSLERYVRRVTVDMMVVRRVMTGHVDPVLMRDLRTAILAVMRLAQRRR